MDYKLYYKDLQKLELWNSKIPDSNSLAYFSDIVILILIIASYSKGKKTHTLKFM